MVLWIVYYVFGNKSVVAWEFGSMGNHQFDRIFCSVLRCGRLVRTTKTGLAARSCVLILMKNLLPNSVKHLENQWVAGDRF